MWIYDPFGIYTDDYYYYYYTYGGQAAAVAGFFLTASLIFFLLCFCCLFEERQQETTYTYVYPRPTVLQVNVPPDGGGPVILKMREYNDRETNNHSAPKKDQKDPSYSPDSQETISLSSDNEHHNRPKQ